MAIQVKETIKKFLPSGLRVFLSGRKLLLSGEREARILSEFITPGSVAIDVGANVGKYSYVLARLVGPNGLVVCIEPVEENAKLLRSAARQFHFPFDVRNCVVSSHQGTAQLAIPVEGGQLLTGLAGIGVQASSTEERTVEMTTVDSLTEGLPKAVTFIKIDTEGHEYDVLLGARNTLIRDKPSMLIEIEERHSHRPVHDVFALIKNYGYQGFFLDPQGERISIDEFSVEEHQRRLLDNPFSTGYINNFIFVHPERNQV